MPARPTFSAYLAELHAIDAAHLRGTAADIRRTLTRSDVQDLRDEYDRRRALPGGSGLRFGVVDGPSEKIIAVFDPELEAGDDYPPIVGAMTLAPKGDLGAWHVDTISVVPEARGRRVGLSLYGLALTELGLRLSANTQTPDGRRMWRAMAGIPAARVEAVLARAASKLRHSLPAETWDALRDEAGGDDERALALMDRLVRRAGGRVEDGHWWVPVVARGDELAAPPLQLYSERDGNAVSLVAEPAG